jgi:hypothetical protein
MTAIKKELPKRKQVRDWAKMHETKRVRSAAKQTQMEMLVQHHNELLARFFGIKSFSSEVANKVDAELSAQRIGVYR